VCCRHSGDIDKDSVEITILSSAESEDTIQLKTGVFFREVLAGCVYNVISNLLVSLLNLTCSSQ
jgi:hypothetical protein